MGNECLVIKLPGIVDGDFRKLNEMRIPIQKDYSELGVALVRLYIASNKDDKVPNSYATIRYSGGFFSDADLTQSLGTTLVISRSYHPVYFKLTKGAYLSILNANLLTKLSANCHIGDWAIRCSDAFLFDFNEQMPLTAINEFNIQFAELTGDATSYIKALPNLYVLGLTSRSYVFKPVTLPSTMHSLLLETDFGGKESNVQIDAETKVTLSTAILPAGLNDLTITGATGEGLTGTIKELPNQLKKIHLYNNINKLTGDLKDLPPELNIIRMVNSRLPKGQLVYTGNSFQANREFSRFEVFCPLETDQLDNLLIALSKCIWNQVYKMITLVGFRSAKSDSAIIALQNKGVTVTITE